MPAPNVKSAARVLAVLEHFAVQQQPRTVVAVSRALRFPQSSTSKLLATLERLGYLHHDSEARTYRPTLRVLLLGAWLHDELFGEGSLVSAMDGLRRRTGLTVMVGMRQGAQSRLILALRGTRPDAVPLATGMMTSLCNSAIGHVLLAEESETALGAILRRSNAEEADRRRVTLTELREAVEAARRQGWAYRDAAALPGRGVIAAPLPRMPGQPRMAIALGAPVEVLADGRDRLVKVLLQATANLARRSPAESSPRLARARA